MTTDVARYAHKEFRPVIRAALRAGWTVAVAGNGHLRFTGPGGIGTTVPVGKAMPYAMSRLRRAGVPGVKGGS